MGGAFAVFDLLLQRLTAATPITMTNSCHDYMVTFFPHHRKVQYSLFSIHATCRGLARFNRLCAVMGLLSPWRRLRRFYNIRASHQDSGPSQPPTSAFPLLPFFAFWVFTFLGITHLHSHMPGLHLSTHTHYLCPTQPTAHLSLPDTTPGRQHGNDYVPCLTASVAFFYYSILCNYLPTCLLFPGLHNPCPFVLWCILPFLLFCLTGGDGVTWFLEPELPVHSFIVGQVLLVCFVGSWRMAHTAPFPPHTYHHTPAYTYTCHILHPTCISPTPHYHTTHTLHQPHPTAPFMPTFSVHCTGLLPSTPFSQTCMHLCMHCYLHHLPTFALLLGDNNRFTTLPFAHFLRTCNS